MTYPAIAKNLDIVLCEDCSRYNHKTGAVEVRPRRIHWAGRKVSRPGLRNFLVLAAAIYLGYLPVSGVGIWRANIWAYQIARRKYRALIPANKSKHDRRKAYRLLRKLPPASRPLAAWNWAKENR